MNGPSLDRPGCCSHPVLEAVYTPTPVVIAGVLDDPVWKTAPCYALDLPRDVKSQGKTLEEAGQVQLAWDDANLYVGIRFMDSDVVAEGDRDQMHHFETGDVAEVFLRPANQTYYWELYATPHGKRSSYFMPGRGRIGLPSCFTYPMDIEVASTVQGVLNDWRTKDTSWTTEIRIPIRELERHGDKFGPGQAWTILIARYNYSRFLTQYRGPELSSCPALPITDWHYLDGYAELRLVKSYVRMETCMRPLDKFRPTITGGVTLPAEAGQEGVVRQLAQLWGADSIRDSDGTKLSEELLRCGYPIYSTICLVRADQQWPKTHPDQLPQKFLMSDPVTATGGDCVIMPLEGFFQRKYRIDVNHDPHRYWQVFDRTTGEEVLHDRWSFDAAAGRVAIAGTTPFHVYTVNFLVYQIWDSTSMYNHLTNQWTCDPIVSVEPYYPETWDHLMGYFDRWIADHPHTSVVRLTSLAYHFTLDSRPDGSDKYRDWTGYTDTISIPALDDFEKQYGYRITSEDIVDQGYYNATYRVPSKAFRDWMAFVQNFVHHFGKALVDKAHAAGKKAGMFFGDHWSGSEPYSDGYLSMGLDINIGAAEDGVALRRCADTPGGNEKEVRFYPYFFPDVFREGGDPKGESLQLWMQIRRAMLRKQVDRIGYGGYLSLAARFPDFTDHVADICDQFRTINEQSNKTACWTAPVKVGVLTCWGKLRSWLPMTGRSQKFRTGRPDIMIIPGPNLLECLSGLPVEVTFFSFDDILDHGIPRDINVIINDGDAGTAWSGGRYWADPAVVAAVREFVFRGGGFLGSRDPSAHEHGGRFYQLSDVMGVQKEMGQTLERLVVRFALAEKHFITDDNLGPADFGYDANYVYCCDPNARVLAANAAGHVHLAANTFGKGRSVFLAGLPFNLSNARLLYRAFLWAAGQESHLQEWFCDNLNTECAFYPQTGRAVAINNTAQPQTTAVYDAAGVATQVALGPHEMKWFEAP